MRKDKMKKRKVTILIFLILCGVLAFVYYNFTSKQKMDEEVTIKTEANSEYESDYVYIYTPDSEKKGLLEKRIEIEKAENQTQKITRAFNALVRGAGGFINRNSTLLNVFVENDTVYLNISSDFKKGVPDDSNLEMLYVYSVVNTMTKIDNIRKVKFLINGSEVETLGGFINLKDYFERDGLLIK